jgi:hypothetical protein
MLSSAKKLHMFSKTSMKTRTRKTVQGSISLKMTSTGDSYPAFMMTGWMNSEWMR